MLIRFGRGICRKVKRMKLNNEICVSFLQGSGWMRNHDEKIKNGIIDKFVNELEKDLKSITHAT